ncbi:MAG: VirB3 family type IV secretion system protein [Sedimenticola sp.]
MEPTAEIHRPLFLGMTRPPMFAGVTFNAFVLNSGFSIIVFLGTGELPWILIGVPFHLISYLICEKDPNLFDAWAVKFMKTMTCINKKHWENTNSYLP